MQTSKRRVVQTRTGSKAGIWLALTFALVLHLALLLVPPAGQKPAPGTNQSTLEIQLTASRSQTQSPLVPVPEPDEAPPEPTPVAPQQPEVVQEELPGALPATTEAPPGLIAKNLPPDMDNMSEPDRAQLTNTILARQFFTEESAADKLFGTPLEQDSTEPRKEFHYPRRQNMLAMLDKPLPDVPLVYTPGLVHFAYEPGVKGDLQRFWDVITPEFGWRTRYGTEVRCILILVIAGCAWK
jgi:hypothetical protein